MSNRTVGIEEIRYKSLRRIRVLKVDATYEGRHYMPEWYGVFDDAGFCISNRFATIEQAYRFMDAEWQRAMEKGEI